MNLEFTREQLLTLIEAVHMASHIRDNEEMVGLEKTLLECAFRSGLDGMVMPDEKEGYVMNNLISRSLHKEIDDYEDEIFWSALSDELAARDLRFVKSEEEIAAMSKDEYDLVVDGQASRYDAEFDEHGVDHLTLAHPLTVV